MIRKLKLFWSLDPASRRMLTEALLLPGFVWLGFRIVGVSRTQAFLRRWSQRGALERLGPVAIEQACWAQRIVQRNARIAGHCLVRSLTLWTMLRRRGIATDLRVGFRKRDGEVQGHAWLEYDGIPINEVLHEARSYVPYDNPVAFDLWRQVRHLAPRK